MISEDSERFEELVDRRMIRIGDLLTLMTKALNDEFYLDMVEAREIALYFPFTLHLVGFHASEYACFIAFYFEEDLGARWNAILRKLLTYLNIFPTYLLTYVLTRH